jgi:hypothetical protein
MAAELMALAEAAHLNQVYVLAGIFGISLYNKTHENSRKQSLCPYGRMANRAPARRLSSCFARYGRTRRGD